MPLSKEDLDKALDRNIFVYNDPGISVGVEALTRLVALMKVVQRRNSEKQDPITDIFLPVEESEIELELLGGAETILGVKIYLDDRLDHSGEFYKYYEGEGGGAWPPMDKEKLVFCVAKSQSGQVLLGAYQYA